MSFDYRNKRWTRIRERVLREDGYRCQYAKRFGKRVQANTVHHIWPAEDFPEYAYERWNLISLSNEAHNRMHDRTTGRLTEIGEQLRRRTTPPSDRRPSTSQNDRAAQPRAHAAENLGPDKSGPENFGE